MALAFHFSPFLDIGFFLRGCAGCMVRHRRRLCQELPRGDLSTGRNHCRWFAFSQDHRLSRPNERAFDSTFLCRSLGRCLGQPKVCGDQRQVWSGISFQSGTESEKVVVFDTFICCCAQRPVHRAGASASASRLLLAALEPRRLDGCHRQTQCGKGPAVDCSSKRCCWWIFWPSAAAVYRSRWGCWALGFLFRR